MSEPISGVAAGVLWNNVITGAIGGIVSLAFMKEMSARMAIISLVGGAATAVYLGPVVNHMLLFAMAEYLDITLEPDAVQDFKSGVIFLIGAFGMSGMAGLSVLADRFKKDPVKTIKDIKD